MFHPADDIASLGRQLTARREPFAVATVVWRRAPNSGKLGRRAIVTAAGRLEGWIGGACSKSTVVREGLRAIDEGSPRLVCLGLENEYPEADGIRVVEPTSCASEGAVELFVEPYLPKPQLVVFGDEPVARTLGTLAGAVGFEVVAVALDDDASRPEAHRLLRDVDVDEVVTDARTFVVVATMGQYDEDALVAALGTPAPYVALVASAKRGRTVLDALRGRGVPDDQLARVRFPAGLDLGAVAHEEIAVAILAEMVQLKARGLAPVDAVAAAAAPPEPREALDPVCGMTVATAGAQHRADHDGRTFYFCCAGCRQRFTADPAKYLDAA